MANCDFDLITLKKKMARQNVPKMTSLGKTKNNYVCLSYNYQLSLFFFFTCYLKVQQIQFMCVCHQLKYLCL